MKTSKIIIKNLFGIRETTLDGKSVEISGPKGAGKTSVLDAIRFALTNRSERDCIVHQGADEGEIIIETTTGLSIDRKALPAKSAGTVKVRDGSLRSDTAGQVPLPDLHAPAAESCGVHAALPAGKEPRDPLPHRV